MTARILDKAYLIRIAKFLSLTMADGMAKDKVLEYHKLNVHNFNLVNKQNLAAKYTIDDFQFGDVPLISSVQAVSDLEALYKNCVHHGLEIDEQVFNDMLRQLQSFKDNFDYAAMKQYIRHVLL